jgi:hypothetical protein
MPKMEPLRQWICDTCHEPVGPDDGWLEWLEPETGAYDFRITHHERKCQKHAYHDDVGDMHLSTFLNAQGLQALLSMLDVGPLLDPDRTRTPATSDIPSLVEVIRRLHIPFYEEARLYFNAARQDGHFMDNEVIIFFPKTCRRIIERYERERHTETGRPALDKPRIARSLIIRANR